MRNLFILLLVLVTLNCNTQPEVNDGEFNKLYVQPFLKQAKSYDGVWVYNQSLTVIFVDSLYDKKSNTEIAGLTESHNSIIYFNTNHPYWNSDAKIVLIYHELAHFYLGKVHIDESKSCDVPFSFMSLWSEEYNPIQFEYWTSGQWREYEDYYMEEIFRGSNVWKNYPPEPNVMSHELSYPCWN
jgi:hypothetical protein